MPLRESQAGVRTPAGTSRVLVHIGAFRLRGGEFVLNSGASAKPVDNEVESSSKRFRIQCSSKLRESSADCGISDWVRTNRDALLKLAYESNQRSKNLKQESFS